MKKTLSDVKQTARWVLPLLAFGFFYINVDAFSFDGRDLLIFGFLCGFLMMHGRPNSAKEDR